MATKGRFTRRNILSVLCFTLLFGLLFALADALLWDEDEYSGVWTRIRESGSVPEVLILGNSHAFCSFVPDILNGALGIDSAVLASSGGDSVAVADGFEAALKAGTPRLAVVELNAFSFEDGQMAGAHKYFALGNINGMPSLLSRLTSANRELGLESVPQGMFQLTRAELMWSRWEALLKRKPVNRYEGVDVLGYQPLDWFATGTYSSADTVVTRGSAEAREGLLNDTAQAQLRRMLSLARERGVEVWLVKTPTASRTVEHPNRTDAARLIAGEYGGTVALCRDCNDDLPDMKLTAADFYDVGHLNRRGAVKFTLRFAAALGERLGVAPDYDAAFAYAGESVTPLENGRWSYRIEALGRDVLYRFQLESGGETALVSDWSERAEVALPLPPDEADRLIVSICPADRLSEAEVYAHTMRFMTADACVID